MEVLPLMASRMEHVILTERILAFADPVSFPFLTGSGSRVSPD